jgi:hypothetical protein
MEEGRLICDTPELLGENLGVAREECPAIRHDISSGPFSRGLGACWLGKPALVVRKYGEDQRALATDSFNK